VLCGIQREEAPQSGPLKLLLGADPKATRGEDGYRATPRVLGCSFSDLVSKRRVGARIREGREELLLKEISVVV
jgi:hypothetical protein